MAKLVAIGLVLFLSFGLVVSLFQNRILFPTHLVKRAGPMPAGTKRLSVDTPDGFRLQGVHVPPSRERSGERLLVLGFAGNAWNSADVADYLGEVYPQAHVVAFHYRGYAPSTGSPSAEALISDAPLVYDAAVERVRPDRIIAVGFSIGSGVAATLSRKRDLDGLVLVTPFDSLKAVAQGHFPWIPLAFFFRDEIHSAGALRSNPVPVAIIAASNDTLIPPRRTDALRRAASTIVFDRTIDRVGHNDIYQTSAFHDAMRDALNQLLRR